MFSPELINFFNLLTQSKIKLFLSNELVLGDFSQKVERLDETQFSIETLDFERGDQESLLDYYEASTNNAKS
ncbi:MAG: hypothetical protein H0U70_12525 [Tatlockia sp.]|nr:hypothetical protein [Tatlockia sp.]